MLKYKNAFGSDSERKKRVKETKISISDMNQKPDQRDVFRILLKENFRTFLEDKDDNEDYFLDSDDYVHIPSSVGCFYRDESWTVYETDERGAALQEKQFINSEEAFQDAAARRGMEFQPEEDVLSTKREPVGIEQIIRENRLIYSALKTLNDIEQLLTITNHPDSLKEDKNVLNRALSYNHSLLRKQYKIISSYYSLSLPNPAAVSAYSPRKASMPRGAYSLKNNLYLTPYRDSKSSLVGKIRVYIDKSGRISLDGRDLSRAGVEFKPEYRNKFKAIRPHEDFNKEYVRKSLKSKQMRSTIKGSKG